MKRFFLLLPVFFFLNAAGQQPNNSIRVDPLNKNFSKDSLQKLISKFNMKSYLNARPRSTFGDGTKLNAAGQQPNNSIRVVPLNKISVDSLRKLIAAFNSSLQARLLSADPDGTKLYALPHDNMPCLVPDRSQFNMPIAGKGFKIDGMPPGVVQPRPLIPKTD